MSLQGKLALITGCSGGIGQATALAFAIRGCSIAVHYHSAREVAEDLVTGLRKLHGVRAHAFQADMGEYDSVRTMHAAVVDTLGHPDILFNNAGTTGTVVGKRGDIENVTLEDFEQTWKVNTGSSFLLTQLCIPHMVTQKYGRVVFCSSVAAGIGGVVGPHYASSKSAMHGLVHWLAMRYAKEGITCNAIAPALIEDTTMMANPSDEIRNMIPIGRLGKPHEVASVVETLVTNEYLTNKIMVVDDRTELLRFEHGTMIAIFDGHYSDELSQFTSKHLPQLVAKQFDPTAANLDQISLKIFEDFDESLLLKVTELFEDEDRSNEKWFKTQKRINVLGRGHRWQGTRFLVVRRAVVGTIVLIGIVDKR